MTEFQKSQAVRLVDVFLLGPYLWWLGGKQKGPHRDLVRAIAIATIVYNGRNWWLSASGGAAPPGARGPGG